MKTRILMAGLFTAAFAIALATVIKTDTVRGTGRATDSAGHFGNFAVDATKVTHNGASSMHGSFDFVLGGSTSTESTRVHLNSVDGMSVVENKGEIGGPGVLRVQRGTEVHYYEGRVYLRAVSNRHPGEEGALDTVLIYFVPAVQTNPRLTFSGNVTDGDVGVSSLFSY